MIPISDENPTFHKPLMTYAILAGIFGTWFLVQGAGFDQRQLGISVCELGMVPGELTKQAALGTGVPIDRELACVVDDKPINALTPITSMFLHGGWGHILGNALFLWVFGNNIEDSMGHVRFLLFYLICGLAAAGAHIVTQPASPIPTVGASGAISGVMGAYLVLYPRARVNMLFFFILIFRYSLPAWAVLIWWFVSQGLMGLNELNQLDRDVSGGVAVWAHIGGFVAGVILVKVFENKEWVRRRLAAGDARAVWDPTVR